MEIDLKVVVIQFKEGLISINGCALEKWLCKMTISLRELCMFLVSPKSGRGVCGQFWRHWVSEGVVGHIVLEEGNE